MDTILVYTKNVCCFKIRRENKFVELRKVERGEAKYQNNLYN